MPIEDKQEKMQLKVPHFEPLKIDLIKEENRKVLEAKYF